MKYTQKTKEYLLLLNQPKTQDIDNKLIELREKMNEDEIEFIEIYLNKVNRVFI